MIDTWERAWGEFTPFLAFPVELRTIVYTTHAFDHHYDPVEQPEVANALLMGALATGDDPHNLASNVSSVEAQPLKVGHGSSQRASRADAFPRCELALTWPHRAGPGCQSGPRRRHRRPPSTSPQGDGHELRLSSLVEECSIRGPKLQGCWGACS